MSGETLSGGKDSIRWGAVSLGWAIAVVVGLLISPLLRLLYGLLAGPPVERGEFTVAVAVIALFSGFLSYLVGGYAAARTARYSGGKHGAITAVFGLILGVILAFFGVVFSEGVALPPASFGLAGAALAAGLVSFLVNLFGGYVGGKLGEPAPNAKAPE